MNYDYSGEVFLDKLYQGLFNSKEVEHTKEKNDTRYGAIKKYLDRIENAHEKANTDHKKEILYNMYYDKYVIKEENISNNLSNTEKEVIINNQKKGLKLWLDYLSSKDVYYPMWAKYWVFHGMLKMGVYDESVKKYSKRTKNTLAPFVEVNPEIIAKSIEFITKKIKNQKIDDEFLNSLNNTESFNTIYSYYEKKYNIATINNNSIDGLWVKYNQGNEEDAVILSDSLYGKNTQWCTSSEDIAKKQLCGPYSDSRNGGDFYVYYTADKNNEYSIPRIAIRLIDNNKIAEIRGVMPGQNVEEVMLPVLENKLNSFDFIDKESINNYIKKIDNLKELFDLNLKTKNREELNEKELTFLYTKKVFDFGIGFLNFQNKILASRNRLDDFKKIKNTKNREEFINCYHGEIIKTISTDDIDYEKLAKMIIKHDRESIKYISPKVPYYEEMMNNAVTNDSHLIEYIPDTVPNYEKLAEIAVLSFPGNISRISTNAKNYFELAKSIISEEPYFFESIPDTAPNYEELSRIVVNIDPEYIKYISPKVPYYEELLKNAFYKDPCNIIKYVPKDFPDYTKFALLAFEKKPYCFHYIPETLPNYEELAREAIKREYRNIKNISPNQPFFKELAIKVVSEHPVSIGLMPKDLPYYDELESIYNSTKSNSKSF